MWHSVLSQCCSIQFILVSKPRVPTYARDDPECRGYLCAHSVFLAHSRCTGFEVVDFTMDSYHFCLLPYLVGYFELCLLGIWYSVQPPVKAVLPAPGLSEGKFSWEYFFERDNVPYPHVEVSRDRFHSLWLWFGFSVCQCSWLRNECTRVDYRHFALKEQTRYWQDLRAKPSLFPFLMTSDTVVTFTTLSSNRSFLEKQTQESSYGKF